MPSHLYVKTLTASATWPRPSGVTVAKLIEAHGAGGGGTTNIGSGGGGAYAASEDVPLDDVEYSITVGTSAADTDGGDSSFGSLVVAKAGRSATNGGAGGLASSSTGDTTRDGGDGSIGTGTRAGGGGAGPDSAGTDSSGSGDAPGGAPSGGIGRGNFDGAPNGAGGGSGSSTQRSGGAGAVLVHYLQPLDDGSPIVHARNRARSSSSTTHAIVLPSGIQAGELLVVLFAARGSVTCTASGSWAKVGQATSGTFSTLALFHITATGSDSLTITTSSSALGAYQAWRISGSTSAPTWTTNTGTGTNPDAPAHNHGSGKRPTLWLIGSAWGSPTNVVADPPSGYDAALLVSAAAGAAAQLLTAERLVSSESEDPGPFTASTGGWVTATIAIPGSHTAQTTASCAVSLGSSAPRSASESRSVGGAQLVSASAQAISRDQRGTSGVVGDGVAASRSVAEHRSSGAGIAGSAGTRNRTNDGRSASSVITSGAGAPRGTKDDRTSVVMSAAGSGASRLVIDRRGATAEVGGSSGAPRSTTDRRASGSIIGTSVGTTRSTTDQRRVSAVAGGTSRAPAGVTDHRTSVATASGSTRAGTSNVDHRTTSAASTVGSATGSFTTSFREVSATTALTAGAPRNVTDARATSSAVAADASAPRSTEDRRNASVSLAAGAAAARGSTSSRASSAAVLSGASPARITTDERHVAGASSTSGAAPRITLESRVTAALGAVGSLAHNSLLVARTAVAGLLAAVATAVDRIITGPLSPPSRTLHVPSAPREFRVTQGGLTPSGPVHQSPTETLSYSIDWSEWLGPLNGVEWIIEPGGPTVALSELGVGTARAWLTGGEPGLHAITCRVTTEALTDDRTFYVVVGSSQRLGVIRHDPDSTVNWTIDWSRWLPDGVGVREAEFVGSDELNITQQGFTPEGTKSIVWLGPCAAGTYSLTARITTEEAETVERHVDVIVRQK